MHPFHSSLWSNTTKESRMKQSRRKVAFCFFLLCKWERNLQQMNCGKNQNGNRFQDWLLAWGISNQIRFLVLILFVKTLLFFFSQQSFLERTIQRKKKMLLQALKDRQWCHIEEGSYWCRYILIPKGNWLHRIR